MRCLICISLLLFFTPAILRADDHAVAKPAPLAGKFGDQHDGTYVNPILPADFSDIDAIRVDDDFYAISSTMPFSPGMVILHSKDLVNWRIVGHAIEDLTQIGPEMNWDRMGRYGRGVWAGAIRHHAGKFWIYFGTPDEGLFVTTAKDAAGPWAPLKHVLAARGWDDCCPFWDEGGAGYLVATNFADNYTIHLFGLSDDGASIRRGSDRIIHQSRGSEANKLYKIGGIYYHYFSEVRSEGRVAMMERAASLDGPWEIRQLNHVNKKIDREPNQGGLIELADDRWFFLTHHGTGDWEGRPLSLLPVTWLQGWPVIGAPGADGIGQMVWRDVKPINGPALAERAEPEEFDLPRLSPQWEWNHQPRADMWSLSERPGFLRLRAFPPRKPDELLNAGNTLTRRMMRRPTDRCEARIDISQMVDGQRAGLCHFAKTFASIGVWQDGGTRTIAFDRQGKTTTGPAIKTNEIFLRCSWDIDGNAQFAYSTDGDSFTILGDKHQLAWGNYRGERIGLFCYNNNSVGGLVDVDWVH